MKNYIIYDQMTPKERGEAYSKGLPIDRIPCVPQMGVTMAPFIGVTTREYYHSAELMAKLEIELFKKFNHDSVGVGMGLHGIAEAMGTELEYPKNAIAYVKKPVLNDIKEVNKLSPANPYKDGTLPLKLEGLKIVKDTIGHQVDVGTDMPAPFSAAASLIGTDKFLRALIKNPDEVHEILKIVTETNLRIIDAICELDAGLCMSDPIASTTMVSPRIYKEFAMPYAKKCIDRMREKSGKGATIHICGRSKEIWDYVVETGITTFSLDNIEDIEEAKNLIGDKVCISGNVSPVKVMKDGTKDDVYKSSRECIRKGYDSKKGFILSTGCQIPMFSPIENIEALMESARTYGAYPINLQKLINIR